MDLGTGIAIVGGVSGFTAIVYKIADLIQAKRNNNDGKGAYNKELCKSTHKTIDERLDTMEECKEELKKKVEEDRRELADKVESERRDLAAKVESERRELADKIDEERHAVFSRIDKDRDSIEGKVEGTRKELVGLLTDIGRKIDGHIKFHAEK